MDDLQDETARQGPLPHKSCLQRLPSIEVAAKGAGLSAVFFYAIGVLIQNLYLGRFGVTDFDLLQANSITTGLLCALSFFLFASPIYVVYSLASRGPRNRSFRTRRRIAWLFILLSFAIFPLCARSLVGTIGSKPSVGEAFFMVASGLIGSVVLAMQMKDNPSEVDKKEAMILSILVFSVTGFIGSFMVYTMANSQFGGGNPTSVVLLLNSEGREVWHRLHKNYDDSADPFVYLIHERDTVLVVFDRGTHYDNWHNGTTIVLDRKLIRGFVPRPGPYDSKVRGAH